MKISVIEKIKRLPKQTEESLNDAFTVLLSVEDRKSVDQFSAVHSGISRMTTKDFLENLTRIGNEITDFVRKLSESKN